VKAIEVAERASFCPAFRTTSISPAIAARILNDSPLDQAKDRYL
jgi:hypothetical protein